MSKRVGLTGGIGSGKTTVGQMFAKLGVPIYNSDIEAKILMESSIEVINAIKELLGEQAYNDGRLNKNYISEQIFAHTSLLKNINTIVHPAVRKHFLKWAKRQEAIYVIQEAAIIFEIGSQDFYDKTILITAAEGVRIERLKERNASISTDEIKARMQNQWKDAEKIGLSDFVINNLGLKNTKAEVLNVHHKLLALFEMDKF